MAQSDPYAGLDDSDVFARRKTLTITAEQQARFDAAAARGSRIRYSLEAAQDLQATFDIDVTEQILQMIEAELPAEPQT